MKGGHGDSVVTSHVHTLQSSLVLCVHTGVPPPHLFTEAAVFPRGFIPLLRRSLQALQRLLCQPHQGPKGPRERYNTHLNILHSNEKQHAKTN